MKKQCLVGFTLVISSMAVWAQQDWQSSFIPANAFGFTERQSPSEDYSSSYPIKFRGHNRSRWGGTGCVKKRELRSIVDNTLALSITDPQTGVTAPIVPGISVAIRSPDCGEFNYATGLRDVEQNLPLKRRTPMWLGSLTKLLTTAVTLRLIEEGYFGDTDVNTVLNSDVAQWLTPAQIQQLTIGNDPQNPRSVTGANPNPPIALFRERGTDDTLIPFPVFCPDLSQISLRQLLNSNHGMTDFFNEFSDIDTGFPKATELIGDELLISFGIDPALIEPRPEVLRNSFDYFNIIGLAKHPGAVIGGTATADIEVSVGNTGFQLMGIILEQQTGQSLTALVNEFIVNPLKLDRIFFPNSQLICDSVDNEVQNSYEKSTRRECRRQARDNRRLSRGYFPSFILGPQTVYPSLNFNDHLLTDTRELADGRFEFLGGFGGLGGAAATTRSYAKFMDAFLNGNLLSEASKAEIFLAHDENPITPGSRIPLPGGGENSLGVIFTEDAIAEIPGIELLSHFGSIFGATCTNFVYRNADEPLLSGAVCFNMDRRAGLASIRRQLSDQLFLATQQP